MAKTKISEFDTNADNNTDINNINIAEGCAPSGINNAIRQLMADLKEWQSGAGDIYIVPDGTVSAPSITNNGDTNTGIFFPAADTIAFAEGGVESMRINSSGNVGIGTSSPTVYSGYVTLDVQGSTSGGLVQVSDGTVRNTLYNSASVGFAGTQTNHDFGFVTNGTERMRIDSSGKVGIGVAPAAWSSTYKVLQLATASIYENNAADTFIGANFYYDGTNNKYISTAHAAAYGLVDGTHQWYTAPSGTAGNNITFTERMRISSAGNVGIGNTSASQKLHVGASADASTYIQVSAASTQAYFGTDSNGVYIGSDTAAKSVNFYTVSTERMRITSDGYLRMASGSGGIQFNGDTAAANALDDYEEGTFTPTIVGITTAGTGTYTTQVGRYTKIGNRVYYSIYVVWTAHTGTGNMRVSALPFTSSSATNSFSSACFWSSGVAMTANNYMQGYVLVNATTIAIEQVPTGGGTAVGVPMDTAGSIIVSGHYEV